MANWEAFYSAFREPGFVPGYEIQDHLGGGAFGEVYRACKTSIGKSFAIKFLKVGGGESKGGVERELEHVRHFAQIDHPNLVTIEDMGVAGGVPYLVMGYAGEDTLARRIHQRDLDPQLALRLFVQAARGVMALHDRQLAHFDLKPGNVFLNGETARVGDYGLSKLLADGRQTLSVGRGTPQYMAPEMLRNRADTRADIYSLGVILYESLVFRLPYEPESGLGLVVRENDDPPPFPEGFPAGLIPVISRCLRLDPANRYATVRELLIAMQQTVEQGDAVELGPLKPGPQPPPLPEQPSRPRDSSGPVVSDRAGHRLGRVVADIAEQSRDLDRGAAAGVLGAASAAEPLAKKAPGAPLRDPDPPMENLRRASGSGSFDQGEEGSDIVSAAFLDESVEQPQSSSAPVDPPSSRGPQTPRPSLRTESVGTIPVPPRSESGAFGTLWEAGVLGTEMLGALVGWPLRVGTRLLARSADQAAQAVPGAVGGFLRVLIFFVGCFLLGGLFALVLVAAFTLLAG